MSSAARDAKPMMSHLAFSDRLSEISLAVGSALACNDRSLVGGMGLGQRLDPEPAMRQKGLTNDLCNP